MDRRTGRRFLSFPGGPASAQRDLLFIAGDPFFFRKSFQTLYFPAGNLYLWDPGFRNFSLAVPEAEGSLSPNIPSGPLASGSGLEPSAGRQRTLLHPLGLIRPGPFLSMAQRESRLPGSLFSNPIQSGERGRPILMLPSTGSKRTTNLS